MSKVISPIMTDGTGMAIAQAINHATAVNLALNTASYDADGTLLEVQDARTINETQYASLGEAIRTEVTRIDNEKAVQGEALEGHADRITAVENKANTNATNISKVNDKLNISVVGSVEFLLDTTQVLLNTVRKTGNICNVQVRVKFANDIKAWDHFAKVPDGCSPGAGTGGYIYLPAFINNESILIQIHSSGENKGNIQIGSNLTGGQELRFYVSYFID